MSAQAHFFAPGRRRVDRIQELLHFERLVGRDQRFFPLQSATDKMVDPVFAVRDYWERQMDGFESVRTRSKESGGIKRQARGGTLQIDAVFPGIWRVMPGPAHLHGQGPSAF